MSSKEIFSPSNPPIVSKVSDRSERRGPHFSWESKVVEEFVVSDADNPEEEEVICF